MYTLLWLKCGCCGGDSISLLSLDQPDLYTALKLQNIVPIWFPNLSFESDKTVCERLDAILARNEKLDFLLIEGAIPIGKHPAQGNIFFCGKPVEEWIRKLANIASYTLAVGTCASFGGILTAGTRAPKWTGLQYFQNQPGGFLGADYCSIKSLPVINIAGCPAHPDWVMGTLEFLISGKLKTENLDRYHRPALFYSKLAHHACPRNEYYEFKASAMKYGQQGCLFENLGCKATQCESDCNERLWLGRTGSCTRGGFPCISCTSPLFPDGFVPFFETEKIEEIPTTLPLDVPKAWYVGISGMAKLACPERLKVNAVSYKSIRVNDTRKA